MTNLLAHWQVGEAQLGLLATDLCDQPSTLQTYARRMWIEEMFGDLKEKGFDLHPSADLCASVAAHAGGGAPVHVA